jgi:hypothetical protein
MWTYLNRFWKTKIMFFVPLVATNICSGQGTFGNLDFESASVPSVPPSQAVFISAMDAFPGWTAYVGANPASQVMYNGISVGGALVSIIDQHTANYGNNVIAGNFTATLDAGAGPSGPTSAGIAQTGLVPADAHSILFGASQNIAALVLTLNGQNLPFFQVGSLPNHGVYAADISKFAGVTGELRFTEIPTSSVFPIVFLDSIGFSTASIPEPSALALLSVGITLAMLRAARRPKRVSQT